MLTMAGEYPRHIPQIYRLVSYYRAIWGIMRIVM
jgi:hypothetical protein